MKSSKPDIGKKSLDDKTVKPTQKGKGNNSEDKISKDTDDSIKGSTVKTTKKQDTHIPVGVLSAGSQQRKVIPKITDLRTQRELIKNK